MKTSVGPKNKLKLIEIALLIGLAVFLASGGDRKSTRLNSSHIA